MGQAYNENGAAIQEVCGRHIEGVGPACRKSGQTYRKSVTVI